MDSLDSRVSQKLSGGSNPIDSAIYIRSNVPPMLPLNEREVLQVGRRACHLLVLSVVYVVTVEPVLECVFNANN